MGACVSLSDSTESQLPDKHMATYPSIEDVMYLFS